jgi:hypothetical protein
MKKISILASLAVAAGLVVGCSSSDNAKTGDDQEAVPEGPGNLFDQAELCDKNFQRHAAIREADLRDGLLRWACGDVPGVTGKDLGQEYCEYKAVSAGKIVTRASDVKGKLSCVFTSVYTDVKRGPTGQFKPTEQAEYTKKLADALSAKENLAATADPAMAVMKVGFNSRNAAADLIEKCKTDAPLTPNELRQAACYEASKGNADKAADLKKACRGQDLSKDAKWAVAEKLGARVAQLGDQNYEGQRDIAACLRTHKHFCASPTNCTSWRNSDPMICARVTRAAGECGVDYVKYPGTIPAAVDGFFFTGWTNRALPPGCRKAKVDGKDYDHLVICEASQAEVEDLETNPAWANDLQQFCRDRFANDLVMMAPLRAISQIPQKPGDGTFCSWYREGAPTTPPAKN